MKKNLLLIICSLMVLSVSAQDTLKVNFMKELEGSGDATWDSILVADQAVYDQATTYSAFGSDYVIVKPVWKTTPTADNHRAIDRNKTGYRDYVGPYSQVLRSFIAVDIRYANDCDAIGVEIAGLPEGTYTFTSYHHDFEDMYQKFTASTVVNTDTVDKSDTLMISHSTDTATFNDRHTGYPFDPTSEIAHEYMDHFVLNDIDSVTQYTFDNIAISGMTDKVYVTFKSVQAPDPAMVDHSLKLIVLNGFTITKNTDPGNSVNETLANSVTVYPNPVSDMLKVNLPSEAVNTNIAYSVVDITGKTVLMNTSQLFDSQLNINVSNLAKGSYFIRLSVGNEQVVKKFVVM